MCNVPKSAQKSRFPPLFRKSGIVDGMRYLPALLALASALVAVIRGKWDEGVSWRSLMKYVTAAGWITITLAIASAGLSVADAHKAAVKERELEKQKLVVKRLAFSQLREALGQIINPFVFLHSGECRTDDLVKLVDCSMTDAFLTRIGHISITDRPDPLFLPTTSSWAGFIARSAALGDTELESFETSFRDGIDEDILNKVEGIRKSGELVIMMALPTMVAANQQHHNGPKRISLRLALLGPADADNGYKQFMQTIRQLLVQANAILPRS